MGGGTLLYMAPEQFESDTSAIHPGADLYSFGVLLYKLGAGQGPWEADGEMSLAFAKMTGAPRPFAPAPGSGVPAGLGTLIEQLLARRPADRPGLAADVRAALAALGTRPPPARPRLPAEPFEPMRARPAPSSAALAGVRVPWLAGRKAERAQLWAAAREAQEGRPRAVFVDGPRGSGRTRLCEWLAGTLEESGAARCLHLRADLRTHPTEALARALRRFLCLGRLEGTQLRERAADWLRSRGLEPGRDGSVLQGWLDPGSPGSPAAAADPRAQGERRIALVDRILRAEAGRGLVCVRVEDASGDGRGLLPAGELLRAAQAEPYPLLLLLDVAPPGGDTAEPARILAAAERLALPPLDAGSIESILRDLLPDELQGEIPSLLRAAGGSPSLAVQWARLSAAQDAAARQARGPAASGLGRALPPQRVAVPFDEAEAGTVPVATSGTLSVGQVVRARVDAFVRRSTLGAQESARVLVLLDLLPRPVPPSLLSAALRVAGAAEAERASGLVDEGRNAGLLIREADGGLDFAVPSVGEAMQALASERPDLPALRIAAAEALLAATERGARGAAWRARAGNLLLQAGRAEAALPVLADAAEALQSHDVDAARETWAQAEAAVAAAGIAEDEPVRARVGLGAARAARDVSDLDGAERILLGLRPVALPLPARARYFELRASVSSLRGSLLDALTGAEHARDSYAAAGDVAGQARALQLAADILFREGRLEDAQDSFVEALRLLDDAGSAAQPLDGRWRLARIRRARGQRQHAREDFERVLLAAQVVGDVRIEGMTLRELGNLDLLDGAREEAEQRFREALACFQQSGHRSETAATRISLGELARARGDLREARNEYSVALSAARAHGLSSLCVVALLDLVLCEVALGQSARAARRVEEVDALLPPGSPHRYRPWIEAARAALLAGRGDFPAAERILEGLRELAPSPDADLAFLFESAGEAAARGGESALALDAWDHAAEMLRALGDAAGQARLRGRVAAFSTKLR
jgi:tetratricopeptide (TPR) repeat protein